MFLRMIADGATMSGVCIGFFFCSCCFSCFCSSSRLLSGINRHLSKPSTSAGPSTPPGPPLPSWSVYSPWTPSAVPVRIVCPVPDPSSIAILSPVFWSGVGYRLGAFGPGPYLSSVLVPSPISWSAVDYRSVPCGFSSCLSCFTCPVWCGPIRFTCPVWCGPLRFTCPFVHGLLHRRFRRQFVSRLLRISIRLAICLLNWDRAVVLILVLPWV